jgi:UDP:flavonoid glycosyltransferase YjiC (YdhE family)
MRIALATVGTTGDIAPFVVLARALVGRGHQVTAVTWPVHRSAFAIDGVRVEVAGPHADPGRIAAVAADAASRGPIDQVGVLRDFHLEGGADHYARLRELLGGHDLVVIHTIHSLAHAAVLDDDLRWATATFDPVLLPTASAPPPGMPGLGPLNRLAWAMLDRMLARSSAPLRELLLATGSHHEHVPLFRARSPLLHLVACSPSIIRVAPDWPAGTRVTGAWLDRATPAGLPAEVDAYLEDGPAPIAIAFGSMAGAPAEALTTAAAQLVARGRRLVVQGDVAAKVSSPNLLRIGAVDHRALFPRAAAVVHHGGAGTTHAVCAAGKPSVVVPHVGDQRYWADRLHRLGVAPRPFALDRLDGSALADAIETTVIDQPMRARAEDLAAAMATEQGVEAAISALEAAAAT